jgi:hypothetical protein
MRDTWILAVNGGIFEEIDVCDHSMMIFLRTKSEKKNKKIKKILRHRAQQLVSVVSNKEKDVLKNIFLHLLYTQFIIFLY